jgi:predicted ATPase
VLLGLGTFYFIRGNLQAAQELGAQCLPLVQRQDVPRLRQAHLGLGTALFHLGEFPDAQAHLDQGIALSDPDQNRARPVPAVADPQVVCLCYAALTLWMLGYPDQALKRNQEALALARALEHPYSQTISSALTGWFHQLRRDEQAAERQSEITIALSSEHGFPLWKAQGTLVRGWARARQGHGAEAIEQVREGLSAWRATGAELSMANSLAMLADAYGSSGRPEDGLSLATEGLAMVEKTAERWIEGELNRIKGELLEMRPSPETVETEACFQRALATVRRQRAKSLELRVATSVSRRWQRQGKREAARQMLAEIYASFTEGFDTPDLQDARALLDTLR